MIEQDMTTTAFALEGYRISKTIGVVRGITVRSRSIFGSLGAVLQTLVGGNITLLTELCEKPLIEKNRYKIERDNLTWEVDEFFGENQGLVCAEVELKSEDQPYDKPAWVGEEVTGDPKYFNSNLIQHPFKNW